MTLTYGIDHADRLVSVCDGWTRFARENAGDHLTHDQVLGRRLWSLIPGAEAVYAPVVEAVRRTGRGIRLPFRCDSPDMHRLLEMRIAPGPEGGVVFETTVLGVQPRPATPHAEPNGQGEHWLTVCSWCKRLRMEEHWLDVEDALSRHRVLSQADLPTVTHGICPTCDAGLRLGGR